MKVSFTRFITSKTGTIIKGAVLIVLFASFSKMSSAQTITFTLVKQPCDNNGILVAAVSTGTPPITFTWTGGPVNYTNVSNGLTDTLYNYSGSYESVIADNNSLKSSGYYAGSPAIRDTLSTTAAVCPALGSAKLSIGGGTPPYSVQWSDASGTVVATGNPASLPAGSYSYIITDAAGCVSGVYGPALSGTNQSSAYIGNTTSIRLTVDTTYAKCNNGTATVVSVTGGHPPYSYKWNNGANTPSITGLHMGTYFVTVTDSLGCYSSMYAIITQTPTITVHTTVTNATCLQNNGSVIAFGSGGHSPYTYQWSNGRTNDTINNMVAGTFILTATDANGCIGTADGSITAATPITVTYSTTASACTAPTGTATLNIAGGNPPYSVKWSTYPVQTGNAATGLPPGEYSFFITDSAGCKQSGAVYIPPVSPVTAVPSETDANCTQSNGSASVLVLTGLAPLTYAWSTGATTAAIDSLAAGVYSVTITDKYSCSVTKYVTVNTASPINLTLIPTTASCLFNANGSIAASISGGTAPYTYNWSDGQTGTTATGLLTGCYYLFVRDAAGCVQDAKTKVPYNTANDSCYCTITGKVYVDANSSCTYDSGETLIPNIMVHCSGLGYAFTNANGVYTILAPTGSYTISENIEAYYPLSSCQSNSIPVSVTAAPDCFDTVNFANIINPIHDVSIVTTRINPPILGRTYTQTVIVRNNGTATEPDIQLGYANDGQLLFTGENPSLFIQQNAGTYPNWYSITNGFPALAPGASQAFTISYSVPTNIPLGTSVVFNDTTAYASPMSNWLNDYTPWNNVSGYEDIVVGSFDPNDKEVSPKGTGAPGYITPDDSVISYTVHFQNVGTYAAQNVVVIDTLDPNLDLTTLLPGYSNYNYTAKASDNGIVTFTFNNINLPDSSGQPVASIGVLMYSAHLKHGLTNGTTIKSPASVYFDFNPPVRTNVTLNTLQVTTGIKNITRNNIGVMLYPNPASNSVYVAVNSLETNANSSIRFYNVLGQIVKSESISLVKGRNLITNSLDNLPAGIYFVEVTEGMNTSMQKLSVER